MFGRIFSIKIGNPGEEGLEIIKPELGLNNLRFDADIERFPGVDINKMTINIFNLPKEHRRRIVMEKWNSLIVDFGYEDEGGALSTLYSGNVVRLQHQRESAETTKTTIYSYECGDFVQYGFYNKTWNAGESIGLIIEDVCNYVDSEDSSGGNILQYEIDKGIYDLKLQQDTSFFNSKLSVLNTISTEYKLEYSLTKGLARFKLLSNDSDKAEIVTFSRTVESGKLLSASGLIGIPTLTTEGLQFKCLVNPHIDIYKYVKFDNSMISIDQSGYVPEVNFGAQLDANGVYKVTGLKIHLTNGPDQNYMEVTSLAADAYNDVDYTQLEFDSEMDGIYPNSVWWDDEKGNTGIVYVDGKEVFYYEDETSNNDSNEPSDDSNVAILGKAVLGLMALGYGG